MRNVLERVVECVAATTRYPKRLLVPDADLENDLGVDSVKRVEIVAALADEFKLDVVSQERDPTIRTIEHIAQWLERMINDQPASPGDQAERAESPPAVPAAPSDVPSQPAMPTEPRPVRQMAPTNGNGRNARAAADAHESPGGQLPTSGHENGNGQAVVHASAGTRSPNGQVNHFSPPHPTPHPKHTINQHSLAEGGPSESPLAGRVALVTGSGRGVGRTIARLLAARGATVVINSFHSRDLGDQTAHDINASGGAAIHIWASVANPQHVDGMFDQLEQQIGYLDVLICNASDGRIGSFTNISTEDWDRAFRTNVSGHHQCAMRASQLMQRRGGGSIITMSSIAAQRYVEGLGGQGVIKAAVESMTRHLACELAPFGIRTNCVSGGPVYGELISQYPAARATQNYWESIIPDGEMCSPLELAHTIAFLVSDEARGVNGAVWTVDHGASTRAHSRPLPQAQAAATNSFNHAPA